MNVALVHDYLNQYGGAERTLEVMCEMFPDAPIFTLFYDEEGTRGRFRGREIRRAFPFALPSRFFFWAYPRLIERFDFSGFDLVISSSWSYGKGIRIPEGVAHISYCYTPTRYLWDDVRNYVLGPLASAPARFAAEFFFRSAREWDRQAAQKPTKLVAISNHIASRIREVYGREPEAVIHPPLEVARFKDFKSEKRHYFVMVGRLLPYKKFDLGIEACNALRLPLKIAGEGRDRTRLERMAGPSVEFLGWASDEELSKVYAGARALIFPQVEDFGLVAAEALAAGTPVIAYRAGGALDIVEEGISGLFFDEQTQEAVLTAIKRFEEMAFDPEMVAERAKRFDKSIFQQQLFSLIESVQSGTIIQNLC